MRSICSAAGRRSGCRCWTPSASSCGAAKASASWAGTDRGKSTLLKIVSGIYQADAGRVDVRAAVTPILELGVGWNPDLDAIDNIELLGTVMGLTLRELRARDRVRSSSSPSSRNLPISSCGTTRAAWRRGWPTRWRSARCGTSSSSTRSSPSAMRDSRSAARPATGSCTRPDTRCCSSATSRARLPPFCDRALLLDGGRIVLDGPAQAVADRYLSTLLDRRTAAGGRDRSRYDDSAHLGPDAVLQSRRVHRRGDRERPRPDVPGLRDRRRRRRVDRSRDGGEAVVADRSSDSGCCGPRIRVCRRRATMPRGMRPARCSARSMRTTGWHRPGSRKRSACSTSSQRSRSCRTGSRRSATSGGRGRLNDAICRRCSPATPSTARRSSAARRSKRSAGTTSRCARAARTGTSGSGSSRADSPGAIVPEVLFYYRRRADSMSRVMLDESAYRRPLDVLVDEARAVVPRAHDRRHRGEGTRGPAPRPRESRPWSTIV